MNLPITFQELLKLFISWFITTIFGNALYIWLLASNYPKSEVLRFIGSRDRILRNLLFINVHMRQVITIKSRAFGIGKLPNFHNYPIEVTSLLKNWLYLCAFAHHTKYWYFNINSHRIPFVVFIFSLHILLWIIMLEGLSKYFYISKLFRNLLSFLY